MPIDNTQAIRAFVVERIKALKPTEENKVALQELNLVLTFCDGFEKQNDLLSKALGL